MLAAAAISTACAHQNTVVADSQPAVQGISAPAAEVQPESNLDAEFLDDSFDFTDEDAGSVVRIADPLEPFNRAMFVFNDRLYFWVLKPVAQGYRAVVPTPVRTGVKNFFYNLTAPIRLVNNVLQGKFDAAGFEFARFVYNSSVGVLGFWNPAEQVPELTPSPEDFGQTLARYRIGNGFYIVWPLLGPSTARDTVGFLGDRFLNPVTYVDPTEAGFAASGFKQINDTSFRIGDYEALKESAVSPYQAFRNAYLQYRNKQIAQ